MGTRRGLIVLSVGLAYMMSMWNLAYAVDWSTWELAATDKAYGEETVERSFKGYAPVGFDAVGWISPYHGDWKLKCRTGPNSKEASRGLVPKATRSSRRRIPRKSRTRHCIARLWVQFAAHAGDVVYQVEGTIYVKQSPS